MLSSRGERIAISVFALVHLPFLFVSVPSATEKSVTMVDMVHIPGGTFQMGDLFGDGSGNELPVHTVWVSDFYLDKFEVTVAEYRTFVSETGYVTCAESFDSREKQEERLSRLMEKARAGEQDEEFAALHQEFLESGGCYYWITDPPTFSYSLDCNWRTPLFPQTDANPVVCLAWVDAASYCNWLSVKEGLPPAYEVDSGRLLDRDGKPTHEIGEVSGYRLPTEAEWEFAAREGGKKIRFGNGRNTARASEINFDAAHGEYPYSEVGECPGGTVPVGSYGANSLGLFDMSGNAWEWCSDTYFDYRETGKADPIPQPGTHRVLRGGRWGGDAEEARVFSRDPYEAINRCNNSGFRIARSM